MTESILPDAESLRLELAEAISTFRQQLGQLTQAVGFIVAADSLLLAYGFTQRESGILLIGSLMPILALLVYLQFLRSSTPVIYVAIVLEQQLRLTAVPLMGTYARMGFKPIYALVADTEKLADDSVRESVLALAYRNWLVRPVAVILYCIFCAQFILFLVSVVGYGYRFMWLQYKSLERSPREQLHPVQARGQLLHN
jgi:hypothetical protein